MVGSIPNRLFDLVESTGGKQDKQLTVRMGMNGKTSVRVEAIDNGMGIAGEDLSRIFAHGYTTKKEGHGLGLHRAALKPKAMGGTLTAHSDGPEKGATFTRELPRHPAEEMALVSH